MEWFIENRPDLTANVACMRTTGEGERRLLSIVDEEKLRRVLKYMLDENEFLSPYGIRALSRHHERQPLRAERGRRGAPRGLRARRVAAPGCSAATPTGAGRSGSR